MMLSATHASSSASAERGPHPSSAVQNNVFKHYHRGSCRVVVRPMNIVERAAGPDGTLAVPVATRLPTVQLTPTMRTPHR
jgi:hypothetical protein